MSRALPTILVVLLVVETGIDPIAKFLQCDVFVTEEKSR